MDAELVIRSLCDSSHLDPLQAARRVLVQVKCELPGPYDVHNLPSFSNNLVLLENLLRSVQPDKEYMGTDSCHGDGIVTQDTVCQKSKFLLEVVNDVCLPLLKCIALSVDSKQSDHVMLGHVCRLISTCTQNDNGVVNDILDACITNLQQFLTEKPMSYGLHLIQDSDSGLLDIYTVTEVLRYVLAECILPGDDMNESILTKLRHVFSIVIDCLELIAVDLVGSICTPLLIRVLYLDKGNIEQYTRQLWHWICNRSTEATSRRKQYILLCGFANCLFPVDGHPAGIDLRKETSFWEILQLGLVSKDSLNRKRCLYLIKRIVDICEMVGGDVVCCDQGAASMFSWHVVKVTALSRVWEDVILLLEVFEEKQVHVIRPLLPRMKSVIAATHIPATGEQPLLHTSWLMTILARCSHHESLHVIRWAAETVLSLDYIHCPMLSQGQDKYLSGPMLYSLQEPKLFLRDQGAGVGSMPVVAERLRDFFPACWAAFPDTSRGKFFCATLQYICGCNWGPVPLLYICRGLTFIPASPCLDQETVLKIRELLTGCLSTVDTYIRGATQGFLVQTLLQLTDLSLVPPEDFFPILSLFGREECLQRGTSAWAQCVTWLGAAAVAGVEGWTARELERLIHTSYTKYMDTSIDSKYSTADTVPAHQVSRLLLIASDAAIATSPEDDGTSTLSVVCGSLETVVCSINTHAYMSRHKADKAVQLLVLLVDELGPLSQGEETVDLVTKAILGTVGNCQSEMISYMSQQLPEAFTSLDDLPLLTLYTDGVAKVMEHVPGVKLDHLATSCVNLAVLSQAAHSLHGKLHRLASMCMLGTISHFLIQRGDGATTAVAGGCITSVINVICEYVKTMTIDLQFTRPSEDSVSQQEWGRVTSLYLQQQWTTIQVALRHSAPWCPVQELLALATETLSVGQGDTSVAVMDCITLLIDKAMTIYKVSDAEIAPVLDACWSVLEESRGSPSYWSLLKAFVCAIYQPCLLMAPADSPVIEKLNQFARELVSIGEDRSGVANVLACQLCRVWRRPGCMDHVHKFTSLIVEICLFGNIQKRGDRQVFDVCASIESIGPECSVNQLKDGISNQDLLVRAAIVNFLCRLNPAHKTHCLLATEVVHLLVAMYTEMAQERLNHFVNSLLHRRRNRLVQIILLLEPFMGKEYVDELWRFLWGSLEVEPQPSVRPLMEWTVMRLMARHPHLLHQIWQLFDKYRDTKNMVLCSLLCIVVHMGPHLDPDKQEAYYNHAIPSILPWCMAHHFNTRIFAQATLVKLWGQCEQLQLTAILQQHAILRTIVHFSQGNRNSTKNVKKLLDGFYFKFLDFKRDYSLETVFHTLPSMTGLTDEDWIPPALFSRDTPGWHQGRGSCYITLHNTSDALRNCEPGFWRWKGGLNTPDDDPIDDRKATDIHGGGGDVQKKIMPWKQMAPDDETQQEVEHGVKRHEKGGLVVVTSLITKVPNLGGLCRTSEIFGVSEYVLGKLNYTEDKAFQGLSVTAEKWLPITEVYETRLPEYLQQKRLEGYTLVGVEQTANSVSLTDYTFPVKTLLLLGNEKEGIPVELISLLDVCVEIPQQGVIRSLNVHVSGALLIWEYRRQQLVHAKT